MKIRSQFAILLIGILLVPVLFTLGFSTILRLRSIENAEIPDRESIYEQTGRLLDTETWEQIEHILSRHPKHIQSLVLDGMDKILYSTMEPFATGESIDQGSFDQSFLGESAQFIYVIETIKTGSESFLLITRMDRSLEKPPGPYQRMIISLVVILGFLFIFSSVISIFIARSITNSVSILDRLTRRIADGELDLELELAGSNEITSLASSLNHLRLSLKEEESRRARFIMGVSHDLKTPLALIKGYTEAMADGVISDPEEQNRSLGMISAKVDQLEGMINDLIGYVRLNSGEWQHRLQRRPLAPFLREFCHRMEKDARILSRRFSYRIDLPDSAIIPFDEALLSRALENLCSNALRYTNNEGTVQLEADTLDPATAVRSAGAATQTSSAPSFRISISDNGIAISPADLPHIFDLFWKASGSRQEPGMGIGLAVVRSVVESHGWNIQVESEQGMGSRFSILIPDPGLY